MAKLRMQKIEIIALLKDSKKVVERLQRRGVVEILDNCEENLVKVNTNASISQFERCVATATQALEQLNKNCDVKDSFFNSLNGRKALSNEEFSLKTEYVEKTYSVCLSILECIRKVNELYNEITKVQTAIDILKPWQGLDLPQNFKGTKTTKAIIGTLPYMTDDIMLVNELNKLTAERVPVEIDIISSQKEQTCFVAVFHNKHFDIVNNAFRELGFIPINQSGSNTPAEDIERYSKIIVDCKDSIKEYENKLAGYNGKQEDIKFLIDFYNMKIDKYSAVNKLSMTQNTVIINGYIPYRYVDDLIEEFEKKYTIAISAFEPDEDDDVPVLLQNGKFSSPVEGITEMYALPNKRDVDPSAVMAFFYYLFFGMMLSDAGYGLIMVIGTTYVLKKFTIEGSLRKSLTMFQYCGISTLFWGALFGSWFGDLPQVIASNFFGVEISTTALWFEPLDDPIRLLLFSFGLGILHLFLGLAVNFKILWCEGKRFDAFCEVIPVYLTILGVAPMAASILTEVPASLQDIGKWLMIAGVVLIILTSGRASKNIFMRFFGGLYGIYNIATGYLSDILSYSRLLALGLATGSIAGVVNLIATMPENNILKAIMLVVVGLIGHTANLGINMLGAYVHSDRLQFVELFSKFYEGGGRAFAPLKVNTKFIKFKKENIYE